MGRALLEYYCGNCNNILREDYEITLTSLEPCPICGTLLSETLQRRQFEPRIKTVPTFQKASAIPRITFDISKLDSILNFLTLNQKICITGIYSQKLIERLCIRAQLPHRYGGLDSDVLLIDGANSSDLYQCISFGQEYQLDVKKVLEKIITTRAFTAYQLANLILNHLEKIIKTYNAKILILTDVLHFFVDPYFDSGEVRILLEQITQKISKIKGCLVIVSLSKPTQYDSMFLQLFDKTLEISKQFHRLQIKVNDGNKTKSVLVTKKELETVPYR